MNIYIIETWFYCESFGEDEYGDLAYKNDKSMPRVFVGDNAKELATSYMDSLVELNDLEKCNPCWNKELAYRTKPIHVGGNVEEGKWWMIYQMYKLPESSYKIELWDK